MVAHFYGGTKNALILCIFLTGTVPSGVVQPAICNLADIGVTAVDIAGGEPIRRTDGHSLQPTLQGNHPADWANETFSEFCEAKYTGDTHYASRIVRSGPWKCWFYGDGENLRPALFNLDDDPNDLSTDPTYSNILCELLTKIYNGWDPQAVTQASLDATADHSLRSQWAKAVRPAGPPEAMGPPPPGYEHNVELI